MRVLLWPSAIDDIPARGGKQIPTPGPFALTLALHDHHKRHGPSRRVRVVDFKKTGGDLAGACTTSRALNAWMDQQHPKYASLGDDVPFILDRWRVDGTPEPRDAPRRGRGAGAAQDRRAPGSRVGSVT